MYLCDDLVGMVYGKFANISLVCHSIARSWFYRENMTSIFVRLWRYYDCILSDIFHLLLRLLYLYLIEGLSYTGIYLLYKIWKMSRIFRSTSYTQ